MIKYITIALFATLLAYNAFITLKINYKNKEIKQFKQQNLDLQEQLKTCKSENEAREFESKWSEEFSKVYELNSTDLEAIGTEDEEILKSSPNTVFNDTF